jgi:hypothetical protein
VERTTGLEPPTLTLEKKGDQADPADQHIRVFQQVSRKIGLAVSDRECPVLAVSCGGDVVEASAAVGTLIART